MAMGARARMAVSILKGLSASILVTLAGMAMLACAVVKPGLSDGAITACNQAIKIISVALGAFVAVGAGGERGFALGAVTGLLYMALGYALYCMLDGSLLSFGLLAGEFLMGALLGALSGAVTANLKPRKRRARAAA